MKPSLSRLQLQTIQNDLTLINDRLLMNEDDEMSCEDLAKLELHIQTLEKHHLWARINESGLRLIDSPAF